MFYKNPKYYISLLLGGIGSVLFLGAALIVYMSLTLSLTATKIPGKVIELNLKKNDDSVNSTYYPKVSYELNGTKLTFDSSTGRYPSPYKIGDPVTLLIDPKNPNRIKIDTFYDLYGSGMILLGIGFVMGGIGIFIGYKELKYQKLFSRLRKFGIKIEADFLKVESGNIVINHQNSYIIHANYLDPRSGKIIEMKSNDLFVDPTNYIPPSKKIQAYLDPKDSTIYVLDTSFVPNHV